MLGELVQTTAGKWITHPPKRFPNGHNLGPPVVCLVQRARRQMPAMPGGEYQRVLVDTDVTCHVIGCRQQVRRDVDISDVRL